jgi:hypothetical protein
MRATVSARAACPGYGRSCLWLQAPPHSTAMPPIHLPHFILAFLALAVPMCILYEIGIWAAQLFIKHTKAPGTAEEETASS